IGVTGPTRRARAWRGGPVVTETIEPMAAQIDQPQLSTRPSHSRTSPPCRCYRRSVVLGDALGSCTTRQPQNRQLNFPRRSVVSEGMTNADLYNGFLDALNRQDLAAAEKCVDVAAYRENCVGFTPGWIAWPQSRASITTIWKAIPDLHV